MGYRELSAFLAIGVALLFLEFIPRRIHTLSHDFLRATFRAVGIFFLIIAGATLAREWDVISSDAADGLVRLGVWWVASVVVVFGGADLYAWWEVRRRVGPGR